MDCDELDDAWKDTHAFFRDEDAGFAIAMASVMLVSVLLLVLGEFIVRPVSALIGGIGGAGSAFVITFFLGEMTCQARVVTSATTGVAVALLALCIYKKGLFLIGAAGFGAVAHLVFRALSLPMSPYYYVVVPSASAVGGVVTHCQRRPFVRICSSLLGAGGVVVSLHLVYERNADRQLPSVVTLAVFLSATLLGIGAQHAVATCHRRRTIPRPPPALTV